MLKKLLNRRHVCPCWLCLTLDNPLRKIFHDPISILSPYIRQGDTILDIGPGMGYFTIPLARLAGPTGRVIAIDVQQKMLSALTLRAAKRNVADRITTHLASSDSLGFNQEADFILAFWMVHEVPNRQKFLSEIYHLMKPQSLFLLVEPFIHVSRGNFLHTIDMAKQSGFLIKAYPKIRISQSVLFMRNKSGRYACSR